ncbi:MAG: DUF4397 domain-containing protein [Chryseolinea sp.]
MVNLRRNFRFSTVGSVALVALLLTGCDLNDDGSSQPIPLSYVTLFNAVPNAPKLDVIVDNRQINSWPFEFGDNTGYLNFYTGSREIKFTPDGANNVVADTTVTLVDGNVYSMFVVDEIAKAGILITNDSTAGPGDGKTKIRLVNLSPDSSPVTLKIKDDANNLVSDQGFKSASAFVELDPKNYNFDITSAGGEPIHLTSVDLPVGTAHTIVVRGYKSPPAGNTNLVSASIVRN